jgi:hypothetical protein
MERNYEERMGDLKVVKRDIKTLLPHSVYSIQTFHINLIIIIKVFLHENEKI